MVNSSATGPIAEPDLAAGFLAKLGSGQGRRAL